MSRQCHHLFQHIPFQRMPSQPKAGPARRLCSQALQEALLLGGLLLGLAPHVQAGQPMQPVPESGLRPLYRGEQYAPAMRGLWHDPGYGFFYRITKDRITVYNEAQGLCWPDDGVGEMLNQRLRQGGVYAHRRAYAVLALDRSDTQHLLRPLPRLPSACEASIRRDTPLYSFDALGASLVQLYSASPQRGARWLERWQSLRPSAAAAQTDEALRQVMAELLRGLKDFHTNIEGEAGGQPFLIQEASKRTWPDLLQAYREQSEHDSLLGFVQVWQARQREALRPLFQPGSYHEPEGQSLSWGMLPGQIGYLGIDFMHFIDGDELADEERERMDQALDRALLALQDSKALLIDISKNLGGDDQIGQRIAARFADRKRLVYWKKAHGARDALPQGVYIAPSARRNYRKPVYLLTSDFTPSAAETFTLMMRAIPGVTQVGETTQGIFSDALVKSLPNGWELSLSAEIYVDTQGRNHEAHGITPRHEFPVFDHGDSAAGYVRAVQAAAALARNPQ